MNLAGRSGYGGNTGGAFAINATDGQITVANKAALDYETTPSFALTVEVEDSYGETDDAVVTIDLHDLEATLSIDDVSVIEGNSDTTALGFTISVAGDAVNDDLALLMQAPPRPHQVPDALEAAERRLYGPLPGNVGAKPQRRQQLHAMHEFPRPVEVAAVGPRGLLGGGFVPPRVGRPATGHRAPS